MGKYQATIGNYKDVYQRRLGRLVVGKEAATWPFGRVQNSMPNHILHDFPKKMMRDFQVLGEFLQTDLFLFPPVNRYEGDRTKCVSERF